MNQKKCHALLIQQHKIDAESEEAEEEEEEGKEATVAVTQLNEALTNALTRGPTHPADRRHAINASSRRPSVKSSQTVSQVKSVSPYMYIESGYIHTYNICMYTGYLYHRLYVLCICISILRLRQMCTSRIRITSETQHNSGFFLSGGCGCGHGHR